MAQQQEQPGAGAGDGLGARCYAEGHSSSCSSSDYESLSDGEAERRWGNRRDHDGAEEVGDGELSGAASPSSLYSSGAAKAQADDEEEASMLRSRGEAVRITSEQHAERSSGQQAEPAGDAEEVAEAEAPVSRERFAVEVAYVELREERVSSGEYAFATASSSSTSSLKGLLHLSRDLLPTPKAKRKPKPAAFFHLKVRDRLKNAEWLCERRRSEFANLAKNLTALLPDGSRVPAPKSAHTGLLGLGGHAPVETERVQLDSFTKRVCALAVFRIPESHCSLLPFWMDQQRAPPASIAPLERVALAKYEADTWLEPETPGAVLLEFLSRDAHARVDMAAGTAEDKQRLEDKGREISQRSSRSLRRLSNSFVASRVEQWVTQRITDSAEKITQGPSASDQDRAAGALKELLSTERSYLSKLMWCVQKYKIPLELRAKDGEEATVLTMEEISALFGNLEEVRDVAKGMVQRWQGLSAAGELDSARAAEAVEECLPQFLTVYRRYTRNFAGFAPLYASLKENSGFVAFEREAERDSRAEHQTLIDVLIMPVQRVPRVKMLFHEMLKGEDNLAAGARLRGIEDSLDAVLNEINSSMEEN